MHALVIHWHFEEILKDSSKNNSEVNETKSWTLTQILNSVRNEKNWTFFFLFDKFIWERKKVNWKMFNVNWIIRDDELKNVKHLIDFFFLCIIEELHHDIKLKFIQSDTKKKLWEKLIKNIFYRIDDCSIGYTYFYDINIISDYFRVKYKWFINNNIW